MIAITFGVRVMRQICRQQSVGMVCSARASPVENPNSGVIMHFRAAAVGAGASQPCAFTTRRP
jgi:hypothetical protein